MRLVPEILRVATGGIGLTNNAHDRASFAAERVEFVEVEAPLHFNVIDLRNVGPRLEDFVGQQAIVGHENQAAGGVIEIANGIDALRKSTKKIAKSLAAGRIGEGGNDLGRFVHDQVDGLAGFFDEAACGFDFVDGRIGFGAKFANDLAVDEDLAGQDELLGVTTRSDAGVSDNFLKAFEHCFMRIADNGEGIAGDGLPPFWGVGR